MEKRFIYQKYLSPADRDEIAASLGLSNAQVISKKKKNNKKTKLNVSSNSFANFHKCSIPFQVITWFQNRRAKLKRDMEELKKDVETVKVLTAHKTFLENVNDLGILKKKAIHDSAVSLMQPGSPD